jgi:hypothetical protein
LESCLKVSRTTTTTTPHNITRTLTHIPLLDRPSFIKEVYAVEDIDTLRKLLIDKERERQSVANDLDVAARLGLVISETNEAIQIKVSF